MQALVIGAGVQHDQRERNIQAELIDHLYRSKSKTPRRSAST